MNVHVYYPLQKRKVTKKGKVADEKETKVRSKYYIMQLLYNAHVTSFSIAWQIKRRVCD